MKKSLSIHTISPRPSLKKRGLKKEYLTFKCDLPLVSEEKLVPVKFKKCSISSYFNWNSAKEIQQCNVVDLLTALGDMLNEL
ncbi:MAG: hypothetical protein K8I29_18505 [Alphaproteobacteria bacterium]|uniref:Uncharacterized protein n=1 Tax=Candidatus Nitrobium versatile TaxID=2884831 RepID=A0A953M3A2_9BACT|nr:hypothetical protein [Candidatus Nitrobium versatile]